MPLILLVVEDEIHALLEVSSVGEQVFRHLQLSGAQIDKIERPLTVVEEVNGIVFIFFCGKHIEKRLGIP